MSHLRLGVRNSLDYRLAHLHIGARSDTGWRSFPAGLAFCTTAAPPPRGPSYRRLLHYSLGARGVHDCRTCHSGLAGFLTGATLSRDSPPERLSHSPLGAHHLTRLLLSSSGVHACCDCRAFVSGLSYDTAAVLVFRGPQSFSAAALFSRSPPMRRLQHYWFGSQLSFRLTRLRFGTRRGCNWRIPFSGLATGSTAAYSSRDSHD
jgi:hypothetical protein